MRSAWRATVHLCMLGTIVGCIDRRDVDPSGGVAFRPEPLGALQRWGNLEHPDLVEASGVVRATNSDNVFWSQNDSGNDALLFAYDSTGASLGSTRVLAAQNKDWEALAAGPCAQGQCLYIGDVGDNQARRPSVAIWRVSQPSPGDSVTDSASVLRVRYPDGPRDVEAMWVARDASVWLLTKRPMFAPGGMLRPAQLYRVSASAWAAPGEQVAELVDSLPIVPLASDSRTWITDAAASSEDAVGPPVLAVRTYGSVFVFEMDGPTGRPGRLKHRCDLKPLREKYGEGLAWLRDGRLLFNAEGGGAPLQVARCP